MFTFTTSIQHSIGSSSHSNHKRKRKKRHPNEKGRSKAALFAHVKIAYIENPMDSTKKLLGLINEFGKWQDTKSTFRNQNEKKEIKMIFVHQQ